MEGEVFMKREFDLGHAREFLDTLVDDFLKGNPEGCEFFVFDFGLRRLEGQLSYANLCGIITDDEYVQYESRIKMSK